MKDSAVRDALESAQEIIAAAAGAPLRGDAAQRLQSVLRNLADPSAGAGPNEEFLSRDVTILLADLRGFTSFSAVHPVGVVLDMLNRYLVCMAGIILHNQGTIDKFMGDGIMVLFGAPTGHPDDVKHALTCAVEMQVAMDEFNRQNERIGLPELYMGIGINTGTVMAGRLGSDAYSEYTVIGDEVNLTSRIEAFSLRGQVLISENTFGRCRDFVEAGEPMDVHVKGKSEAVQLREVLAIPALGKQVPRQEIRRSPRVEVNIPFSFQVIENKIIMPERHAGTILDIGYHGVLAHMERPLPAMSDIRLDLDLSLVGHRARDIYARVLKSVTRNGRPLWGIEFTSVTVESTMNIKHFVQVLGQGSEKR